MLTQHLAAGSWRVTSTVDVGLHNPNNSYGGAGDFVRRSLVANGARISGGATVLVSIDSNVQELVNAGSVTAAGPWTLTEACSHDLTISTGSHWSIVGGQATAIDKGPIASGP